MIKLPLSTKELEPWVPHRAPMIWIDEVLSFDDENSLCRTAIDTRKPVYSKVGLRPSIWIECIAQGFGFALIAREMGKPHEKIKRAFMAGISHAKFFPLKREPKVVLVSSKKVRALGPLTLLDGDVRTEDGELIASAQLKVFGEK